MLFSIFCTLLILLITGFWTNQGLYSAAIMCFECILAMMLAINFYEPLATSFKETVGPQLGEPGLLILIFLASLTIMRVLTDKFLRGTLRLPQALDRGAASIFAFVSAQVLIGTIMLATQMLPLGRSVLGFERYDTSLTRRSKLAFFFNPDGFVVSLAQMIGVDRFSWGDRNLALAKPGWLDDLHLRRCNPQQQGRVWTPPDALSVTNVYRVEHIQQLQVAVDGDKSSHNTETVAEQVNPGSSYLVCRVRVAQSAGEPEKTFVLFTPAQFRLAGPRPTGPDSKVQVYPAVGMSDIYITPPFDTTKDAVTRTSAAVLVKMDANTPLALTPEKQQALLKDNAYEFDVVFEVPTEDFQPWYVEFKQGARCEINAKEIKTRPTFATAAAAAQAGSESSDDSAQDDAAKSGDPSTEETRQGRGNANDRDRRRNRSGNDDKKPDVTVGRAPAGRTHLATAIKDRTGEFDLLPVPLPKEALGGHLRDNKLTESHLVLDTPTEEIPEDKRCEKFWIPEGKKMVQVGAEAVSAKSFLGRPLELARSVLGQYHLQTADDKKFFAVGIYMEAEIDGKLVMELQYHPEPEMPERALEEQRRLTRNVLATRPDYKYGFIFLVDPGSEITHFRTDGRGGGQELKISVSP